MRERLRVLVTGADGRVARRMLPDLARDADLYLTDVRAGQSPQGEIHALDLTDYQATRAAFMAAGADAVLHMAIYTERFDGALTPRDRDLEMNVNFLGTQHILQAAKVAGIRRVVYMSSLTILFDTRPTQRTWFDNDSPLLPQSLYAVTKLAGEHLCEFYARNQGMTVVALRLGIPFADIPVITRFLGDPVYRGMMIGSRDLAGIISLAIHTPLSGYHVMPIASASDTPSVDLAPAATLLGYKPTHYFTAEGMRDCTPEDTPAEVHPR